ESLRPKGHGDAILSAGQRGGPGLQDQRRFDLDDAVVTDSWNLVPARPLSDLVRNDFLAAPRRQDHIRLSGAHEIRRNDPVLRGLLKPHARQDVLAAGDLDQLGDPADAADQGIVPFLEIDFWFWRGSGGGRDFRQPLLVASSKPRGALRRIDQRAQGADHRQDASDVALVEDMNGDAGADQIGDDISLQIREGENEVRLERQDFWNVRRDKCRYPRLLAPDLRRPHRVAGDADDPVLLAEQVQGLHGLFGETHDPAGRELMHDGRMSNYGPVVTVILPRKSLPGLVKPAYDS